MQQKRFVTCVELSGLHNSTIWTDPTCLHEGLCLVKKVGQCLIATSFLSTFYEIQIPLSDTLLSSISTASEATQKVKSRGRLVVCLHKTFWVRGPGLGSKLITVNVIPSVAWQAYAVNCFHIC